MLLHVDSVRELYMPQAQTAQRELHSSSHAAKLTSREDRHIPQAAYSPSYIPGTARAILRT